MLFELGKGVNHMVGNSYRWAAAAWKEQSFWGRVEKPKVPAKTHLASGLHIKERQKEKHET